MKRAAVIGTRNYAWVTLNGLLTRCSDVCQVIAVAELPGVSSPGLEACAERNIPVYDDAGRMFQALRGRCDVVFIPTPIHTHYPLGRLAIEAGFDVFIEKPPVAVVQDHDAFVRFAEEHGRQVGVNFQHMQGPVAQAIKRRLAAGEFGTIQRVRTMAYWTRPDSYYQRSPWAGRLAIDGQWVLDGTINNPLAHMLANALYFGTTRPDAMASPATVQAELYRGHDFIESEDTSSLRIRTDEDVEIIYNATLCADGFIKAACVIETDRAVLEYLEYMDLKITWSDGRVETMREPFPDVGDKRPYVFRLDVQSLIDQTPLHVPLKLTRPFVVSVNAAFDSSGVPHAIADEHIRRTQMQKGEQTTIKTVIEGIEDTLTRAHKEGCLISEVGVPWARPSQPVSAAGYDHFPQNPQLQPEALSHGQSAAR